MNAEKKPSHDEGSASNWPQAKSRLPSVFGNKVLLEQSDVHLSTVYGYFCATVTKMGSCNRGHMAFKASDIYYLAFFRITLLTPGLDH